MFSTQDYFQLSAAERLLPDVRVLLYADEIKPFTNSIGERWMYIALLAIRENEFENSLNALQSCREQSGYNGEVHFKRMHSRQKADVGKLWLKEVMHDSQKRFHFYVLGLRLDYLQWLAFGPTSTSQLAAIYNRFFRASVAYVLRSYFGALNKIVVSCIFHDDSEMKHDRLFDWHTIWRVGKSYGNVVFENPQIEFINSDHRKEPNYPDHSHLIQLTDLVVGATKQCLDMTSNNPYKIEVAGHFLPLVDRLCDEMRRGNRNSRYEHAHRCTVSFFPRNKLSLQELEDQWLRVRSGFFCNRRMLLKDHLTGQRGLFSGLGSGGS
jgi:hypothetical protein